MYASLPSTHLPCTNRGPTVFLAQIVLVNEALWEVGLGPEVSPLRCGFTCMFTSWDILLAFKKQHHSLSTYLAMSVHLSSFPISVLSFSLASFFPFLLSYKLQSPSTRGRDKNKVCFSLPTVPRKNSQTKALLPKIYSTDAPWILSWN